MKKCSICKINKSLDLFYRDKYQKDGFCTSCKECRKKYIRHDKKSYDKQYWLNVRKPKTILQTFGITFDDYKKMSKRQNGKCAICINTDYRYLSIDHDHKNGKIRGLLCNNCNQLLGHSKDNMETLKNAVDYLKRFNK